MEQVLQRIGGVEADRDCRMGGEEMADSGVLMEEDVEVELDSGFCMEVDSALSLAGKGVEGSDREELDWFAMTEDRDSLFIHDKQKERRVSPGGDGGSQEEGEIEADSESVENGQTEAETYTQVDCQTEEEETEGSLDVCLWPVEESGCHVRISLEEVERYYRFSRRCHWLCGRSEMFYHVPSSSLCMYDTMIISLISLSPYCICNVCFSVLY